MQRNKTIKKVTLVIPSIAGGGAEKMVINLANELAKKINKVTIFSLTNNSDYESLIDKKVKLIKLPFTRIRFSWFILFKYLIKEKHHTIISFTRDTNVILGCLNILLISRHDLIFREETIKACREYLDKNYKENFLYRLFLTLIYLNSRCIISQCKEMERDIKNMLLFNFSEFQIINNPIIKDNLNINLIKRIEDPWFKNKNIKVILFLGRLAKIKNIQTIIKAFNKLKIYFPNTRLMICGQGKEEKRLKQLVLDLGLENYVSFKGFVKNNYEYFKSADIVCMSSLAEGTGNSIIEAMRVGVKIVCSKMKGGPEGLLKNKYISFFEPGNPEDLFNALSETLYMPNYGPLIINSTKKYFVSYSAKKYLECISRYST